MPRIRTIKPEFPQSESMGRVSRDARLLFIQLWTIVDDSGRTRAASRMLASLLYPYDDDSRGLIDGWLSELERERCLQRYEVDGHHYIQICNWLSHQKIDKPSRSKFPAPREDSSTPREDSSGDQGGEGKGGERMRTGGEARTREASASPAQTGQDDLGGILAEPHPTAAALPAKPVRERNLGDFQAMHGRVWIPREERDAWEAVFAHAGWDAMKEIYHRIEKDLPKEKRVLLSMVTKMIADHYEEIPK